VAELARDFPVPAASPWYRNRGRGVRAMTSSISWPVRHRAAGAPGASSQLRAIEVAAGDARGAALGAALVTWTSAVTAILSSMRRTEACPRAGSAERAYMLGPRAALARMWCIRPRI